LSPDLPQAVQAKITVVHSLFPTCVLSALPAAATPPEDARDRLEACDQWPRTLVLRVVPALVIRNDAK
jgi:hypothetical protein